MDLVITLYKNTLIFPSRFLNILWLYGSLFRTENNPLFSVYFRLAWVSFQREEDISLEFQDRKEIFHFFQYVLCGVIYPLYGFFETQWPSRLDVDLVYFSYSDEKEMDNENSFFFYKLL